MRISIKGHHGTSQDSAKSIIQSDFRLSKGDKEWLGDGVYFFVKGISSNTVDLARKWAVAEAWDNRLKRYTYRNYCVIESEIKVEEAHFLDLTTEEGVKILGYLVDKFIEQIEKTGRTLRYVDGLILNLARKEKILPIEVVKGNFYIKFAKERIKRINLRTSNCTICTVTVYVPDKNIVQNRIITTGKI